MIIVWAGILVYMAFALGFTSSRMNGQKVVRIAVDITNLDEVQFIGEKEVIQVLKNNYVRITNEPIDSINKAHVKELVDDIAEVKNTQVFFTPDGIFHIKVEQRVPILRVLTGNGTYYLDEENQVLGLVAGHTPRVPVITGVTNVDFVSEKLADLAGFIHTDPFWNAQIEQIQVWSESEIELVPKLGEHRIMMGPSIDFRWKLEKLKALYEKGLPNVGWDIYESIDLRYQNQIVCKKKPGL
ncbi:MAG: hypothetical protein HN352_10455 [Bacteroidetes bacterium]|jgi:cell division protein FtsQ|nr:hypothetical protein [Bacteroidota bacterium]MBT4398493.1 hypothetical protein [Bacteroidota bacterium]MBT4409212.1 hypothetical protein [Bacteroidota bacterium]MBT5426223.1 hypothetical protein [Bacteroidota bacterium]MBT7464473.1 hypothetical protein [Bacteroidota bacterium]